MPDIKIQISTNLQTFYPRGNSGPKVKSSNPIRVCVFIVCIFYFVWNLNRCFCLRIKTEDKLSVHFHNSLNYLYRNVSPGFMGHWVTIEAPSIHGVFFCIMPCQWMVKASFDSPFFTLTSICVQIFRTCK